MAFINDDFLLTTKAARELYHGYAENMPIIDYHCHLPPSEIAEDKRWTDIAQVWLGGDHYKWRQMRSNGVEEKYVTGDASWHDKFVKFAETMERLVKNPLFDWSHLELARYFGVTERLCGASAERIWKKCNAKLAQKGFSAQGLMKKSNVKVVCTTDDPDDTLEWHKQIAKKPFGVKILPAWRPDRILKEAVAKKKDPMKHLAERHKYFEENGCVLSDYGLVDIPEKGLYADLIFECLKMDAKTGWTTQLHFNCIRNLNTRMFKKLGPDTGYDAIGSRRSWAASRRVPTSARYSSAAAGGSSTRRTACASSSRRFRRSAASATSSACSPTRAASSATRATSTSAASSARSSARRSRTARSRPT